ncbi:MAG: YkgJ family cysteine cluster protein [Candidatus Thermoplasmatota archaeon]|nr:YkgJ family cysteine cluster protein [Candidatus Thermoplasmatota archaeon]
MEIDTAELDDLSLVCLEGCALCCLCQAELVGDENRRFSENPELKQGVSRESIFGNKTNNLFLKLKNDSGSCFFLSERKCSIYSSRPLYCRLFPVHVHVGDRVQLVANLSCRGLNTRGDGTPGKVLSDTVLSLADLFDLRKLSGDMRNLYEGFRKHYLGGKIKPNRRDIQNFSVEFLRDFGYRKFIERSITLASSEEKIPENLGKMRNVLEGLIPGDITEAAIVGAMETFSGRKLTELPIWTNGDLRWMIARIDDEDIVMNRLSDDGSLVPYRRIKVKDVGLRDFDENAGKIMTDYAAKLIRRDLTYGYAAYLIKLESLRAGRGKNIIRYFLGTIGTILLDHWWRTSLIAAISGRDIINTDIAREGIIAYDMDYLDLPSLGGFI